MFGYWLRQLHGGIWVWVAVAGAAIGGVLLLEHECRQKVIRTGDPDGGIESCSGLEKTAYEDAGLLIVGIIVGVIVIAAAARFVMSRPCPRCGRRVDQGATRCACGFDFDEAFPRAS